MASSARPAIAKALTAVALRARRTRGEWTAEAGSGVAVRACYRCHGPDDRRTYGSNLGVAGSG